MQPGCALGEMPWRVRSLKICATDKTCLLSSRKLKACLKKPECRTCMLSAPGLESSSSGFIFERLLCIGSPVLLTADSLVGLFCCRHFIPPKTKSNCNKCVMPTRNTQYLLSNFIWRSYSVNCIGYAIILSFSYAALSCRKAASFKLGSERRKYKGSHSVQLTVETITAFIGMGKGRKKLIFHTTVNLKKGNSHLDMWNYCVLVTINMSRLCIYI